MFVNIPIRAAILYHCRSLDPDFIVPFKAPLFFDIFVPMHIIIVVHY